MVNLSLLNTDNISTILSVMNDVILKLQKNFLKLY